MKGCKMKTRIISAVVAIAIAIPFIYLGGYPYKIAIGLIALWSYKEIISLKKTHEKLPTVPMFLGLLGLLLIVFANTTYSLYYTGVSYIYLSVLCFGLIIPTLFYDNYSIKDAFHLIGLLLFIGLGFNSLILVRNLDLKLFLYLVSIPVITDSFALFSGKFFGKNKMCPNISPKKTWEGCIGGSLFGTIIPCILYFILFKELNFMIILITFILTIMDQLGDLIFSKLKRENNIKDYSNIMPGHGGALDRLDSTLVIFLTYVVLSLILL